MGQGALIFGLEGPVLTPHEAAFFKDADPWGFILFARNIVSADQIRALCADLRAAVGRDAPILIDQEGGRVARLTPPLAAEFPPALDMVHAAGPNAERAMWLRGRLIAEDLHALGIDVNCAPLADLVRPDTHAILANRCYGSQPDQVAKLARALTMGQAAGGVLPVLKHIPGHGAGTADSHIELPRVDLPRDALDRMDFAAFAALADLPMAMTAHVVFEAVDDSAPATTSPVMIDLIRQQIGFDGLLMSDDISMQALSGDVATRSRAALAAGCDLILHCNGDLAEMKAIAAASGRLSDAAQARADAALAWPHTHSPIDIAHARAELRTLIQG